MILYTMQENDTNGVHTADSTEDKRAHKFNHAQAGDGENNLMRFKTWVAELLCVRRYCLCYKSVVPLVYHWETGGRHVTPALFQIWSLKEKKKETYTRMVTRPRPLLQIHKHEIWRQNEALTNTTEPFVSVFQEQVSKTCKKDPLHWGEDSNQRT